MKKTLGALGLRGATLVSKFVLIVLLGRHLSEDELGEYGLLISFIMVAQVIIGLEFQRYTTRAWIIEDDEPVRARIFGQHLTTVLCSYVLVAIGFVSLQGSEYALLDTDVPIPQMLALLFFNQIAQESERFLYVMQKPLMSGVVLFIRSGLWVPTLFFMETVSLTDVVNIWLGAQILSVIYVVTILNKNIHYKLPSLSFMWKGASAAKFYVFGVSAVYAMPFVDMYVLKQEGYLEQTGLLALFVSFSKAVHALLTTGATAVFMPMVIDADKRNPEGKRMLLMKYALSLSTIYMASVIVSLVLLKPILIYIGKDFYLDNAYVYWWLLAGVGLLAASDIFRVVLYSKGKDFIICFNYLLAFLTSLAMNLALVPVHGINGTIVAVTSGYGILLLLNFAGFLYYQRSTPALSNSETNES